MNPTSNPILDLAVIGGGASGFFTALQVAKIAAGTKIAIFEKGNQFLQKVRISGGGRCNVTHACFDPGELSKNYPRGSKELRAAFHRWQPADTVEWFARCGVELKTEPDGRMFPTTDSSDTIIDCFIRRARESGITLHQKHSLIGILCEEDGTFSLKFEGHEHSIKARAVCIATGSLKGSTLLDHLKKLGQSLQPLVPSLFAFNVSDQRISGLAGVSHPHVSIRREGPHTVRQGPILITHRGFSGPAVLRLSAWEARELAETNHHFPFLIDWLPERSAAEISEQFESNRRHHGAKLVRNSPIAPVSRRLWERIVSCAGIADTTTWGQLSKSATRSLLDGLKSARFEAEGKTTNKDEFVTCGGIERKTVDFRTMQSRNVPGLYFVGECLDIDGITGGFNFQAAWTTAHIAANDIAASLSNIEKSTPDSQLDFQSISRQPSRVILPDSTSPAEPESTLEKLAAYTGTVPWSYLSPHQENDNLYFVDPALKLETVGAAISENQADQVKAWLKSGDLVKIESIHAAQWTDPNKEFEALVVSPFVLCRPR